MAIEVERGLHMAGGDGENSYAANSRLQTKDVMVSMPVLHKAIDEVCMSLLSSPAPAKMVVADLGCSSGPNTLLFLSEIVGRISCHQSLKTVEVQFFLNDLPGNDFNHVFRSLEQLKQLAGVEEGSAALPPYYVAGLPGSFYTRLFPCQSVHLFHSSYALMWRSKVPEELAMGAYLNEGNIYIGRTTPASVVKLFQEQFRKDFLLFLTLRSEELVSGGRMVLTFLGRKSSEMLMHGEVGTMWELLAQALQILVQKGHVKEGDLTAFNLPYYAPSVDEVKSLVDENGRFAVQHAGVFESNWDRRDHSSPSPDCGDDNGDAALPLDCCAARRSGASIATGVRSVVEPLIAAHFGESIVDELFEVFGPIVAGHLEKRKGMYPVVIVSLKAMH